MSEHKAPADLWKEDLGRRRDLNELTTLNLGPTHPATHGIFQNVLTLDGEIILDTEQTIGYIHRAFEKIAERRPFYQITTLTDRMNYCSAPINNMGWHMAVEKLLGIELPKRVEYMRVIVMELARITDHIICNTIIGQDAGATTPFLYYYQWREKIYEIYEEICGARLTTNMGRIGGFERNFSELAWERIARHHQGTAHCAEGIRQVAGAQPRLHGPLHQLRSYFCGTRLGLWLHRAEPAGLRRGLRRARGRPVQQLRGLRFHHPRRPKRRHLRPLHRAAGGDAPEPLHHPPSAGESWTRCRTRPPSTPKCRTGCCRRSRRSTTTWRR
jgi:hypothetical protein